MMMKKPRKLVKYLAPDKAFKLMKVGGWWVWTGGASRRLVFCAIDGRQYIARCHEHERNAWIIWEYLNGKTLRAIALELGITWQAVAVVTKQYGASAEKKRRQERYKEHLSNLTKAKRARYEERIEHALVKMKEGWSPYRIERELGIGRTRLTTLAKRRGVCKGDSSKENGDYGLQICSGTASGVHS